MEHKRRIIVIQTYYMGKYKPVLWKLGVQRDKRKKDYGKFQIALDEILSS